MKQSKETQEFIEARKTIAQLPEEYQKILGPLSEGYIVLGHDGYTAEEITQFMKKFYLEAVDALDALYKVP